MNIKVGIGVLIVNNNKVLLGHRCNKYQDTGGIHEPDSWTCPGGKQEYEETMFNIYEKYKDEIRFDVDDENALDDFLSKEDFSYFPKDDVLDVLYTILMDLEEHNLMEDYFEVGNMILSLVDDPDLENELKKKVSEMN